VSVYFVTCREANAVKIGSSFDPHRRVVEIQWGCPLELVLEAVLPGGAEEEFTFHRRFEDDNLRGEWFSINPMIEAIIAANPAPPEPAKEGYRRYKAPFHDRTLVARVRAQLRVTQIELARMLDVDVQLLRRLERNVRRKPPQDIEDRLQALQAEHLMGLDGDD
jgi:DNA-binding transcriptional regulator YiaG